MRNREDKLDAEELLKLFSACIDNSFSLFNQAQEIVFHKSDDKYVSLGLAELALEELGKSYSCLAYYSNRDNIVWKEFWKEWRNHLVKAHRAFFYEFFCTWRIEITSPGFDEFFPTSRKSIPTEKEASFYVDIDPITRKIHNPKLDISNEESTNRVTTLFGLFNSSFKVRDLINDNSQYPEYLNAISDYAFLTITTELYQQQVIETLNKMISENNDYNRAIEDIKSLFNSNS